MTTTLTENRISAVQFRDSLGTDYTKTPKAWVARAARQPMALEVVDLGPFRTEEVEVDVEYCGQSAAARHTVLTNLFTGGVARGIMNRAMHELGPLNDLAPEFLLASSAMAPLRARAEAAVSGEFSPLWSGPNPAGCREIPAAELTEIFAFGVL